jgi:hypothetical protein
MTVEKNGLSRAIIFWSSHILVSILDENKWQLDSAEDVRKVVESWQRWSALSKFSHIVLRP